MKKMESDSRAQYQQWTLSFGEQLALHYGEQLASYFVIVHQELSRVVPNLPLLPSMDEFCKMNKGTSKPATEFFKSAGCDNASGSGTRRPGDELGGGDSNGNKDFPIKPHDGWLSSSVTCNTMSYARFVIDHGDVFG